MAKNNNNQSMGLLVGVILTVAGVILASLLTGEADAQKVKERAKNPSELLAVKFPNPNQFSTGGSGNPVTRERTQQNAEQTATQTSGGSGSSFTAIQSAPQSAAADTDRLLRASGNFLADASSPEESKSRLEALESFAGTSAAAGPKPTGAIIQ